MGLNSIDLPNVNKWVAQFKLVPETDYPSKY